ncbi:MAG: hypothetical protein JNM85_06135 [Chthonomonas sp.]|nr:hypothetical protein [Chthonomonas sp.]
MISIKRITRIGLIALGVGLIGYLGATMLPKTYSSQMTLYFPAAQAKPAGGISALTGANGADPDGGTISSMGGALVSPLVASGPQTATGILTSNTCFLDVVRKLKLADYWGMNELKARKKLEGSVSVRTEKTGFLVIEANVDKPELCKSIVSALYTHLQKRAEELTINVSKGNRIQVEKRYADSIMEVEAAREKFEKNLAGATVSDTLEFQRAYFLVKGKLGETRVAQASARRQLALVKEKFAKLLNPKAQYPENLTALAPDGAAAGKDSVNTLVGQIEARRIELADVAKQFAESSPEYAVVKQKVEAAEQLAARVIANRAREASAGVQPEVFRLESQLQALDVSITEYEKIMSSYEGIARQLPSKTSRLASAQAEFNAALKKRETLEIELGKAKLAEDRDASRFEVVDEPLVEDDPIAPRKAVFGALFFLIAVAIQLAPNLFSSED